MTGGASTAQGEIINTHRILVGKPEGKIPFGRHGRRWDDIKTDLRKTETKGASLIHVAQHGDRPLANTVINFRVP